jgi:hypothetical protein
MDEVCLSLIDESHIIEGLVFCGKVSIYLIAVRSINARVEDVGVEFSEKLKVDFVVVKHSFNLLFLFLLA